MKKVTATEARKRWFRLLDEVAAGEVVMLQRRGRRLVLRREEGPRRRGTATGTYHRLLQVPRAAEADRLDPLSACLVAGLVREMSARKLTMSEPRSFRISR